MKKFYEYMTITMATVGTLCMVGAVGAIDGVIFRGRNFVQRFFAALSAAAAPGKIVPNHAAVENFGDLFDVDRTAVLVAGGGNYRLGFEYGHYH